MALRTPEAFYAEQSKVFEKAPINAQLIAGWTAASRQKLEDLAKATASKQSAATRVDIAYDAAFNLALAVLCKAGWRSKAADGHHAQGLEAACAIAGVGTGDFDRLDALRDLRNDKYRAKPPSDKDAAQAEQVLERVLPVFLGFLATKP